MGRRRRAGALRFSRWRLALVFVAFALLTTAHECQDDQGNPIAHQHCWDGSEAAPGGCPPRPTPEPTPEPEPECPAGFWFFWGGCITQCPDGTHIVLGDSCPAPPPAETEVTQADCDARPATIHGQPHQTFPFDGDRSGVAETCAYPGDASHTHNAPPTTHPHTYYPFNRPGEACQHTHAENVSLDGSGNPVVSGHTHWEAGSCQRQIPPVRPPAQRPSPFPPADIGSPTNRAERPPSRDIDGDGTDDLCGSGLNLDLQLPGQQYRACWEGPTDEDIRNHWNLWYVEELINGSWATTSWPTSACGPRVAENQNCGHSAAPARDFWRERYETHGDQVTYVRWWTFRQFECYPVVPGQHKHSPQTCEADHPPVPDCVPGLADDQTQAFTSHNSSGDNATVEVVGCDPAGTECEPRAGEHAHGSVCEADHPPVPDCVPGLADDQTQAFKAHNAAGQNELVDVTGCDQTSCVPHAGEHAHGSVCEADHPPLPSCVAGLPDSQTARYTAHDSSEANISVLVVGCVTTSNRCVPRTGEHAHGSVCEADHPPAPSCVAGLADNQHRLYTTHNAAGHNTVVPVPGCVPTTPPVIAPVTPPEEDEDDPVCDSNWGAGQLAVLASRVRIESYVGAGDEPPTPEVPGGSAFSHVASDRQGGQRRPAWMWLALNGSLLRRGTLDVDDRRDGHECYWEATGVGVQLRELIPAGGGGAEMRTLAAQGRVGAASAITAALGLWDSWTPDEQADWAAVFAPAQRPAAVWCDDDHLPVQRPFGDREASEQARRTACRWEAPRAGIWEWAIWVDYLSDQNDTARKQLGTDVTWFKAIVDLDRDQVTIW